MAAEEGHSDVCQLLIQNGADVNHQRTEVHHDVIMHCCKVMGYNNYFLCIKLLLNPEWLVSSPLRQWLWSPQDSGAVHQVWGTTGHPNQGTL